MDTLRPALRTRCLALVTFAALASAAPIAVEARQAEPWRVLVEDAPLDATREAAGAPLSPDARVDILRVEAREDPGLIRLRLVTREDPAPALPTPTVPAAQYESLIGFKIDRAETHARASFELQFRSGQAPRLVRDGQPLGPDGILASENAQPWKFEVGIHRWALFADKKYAPGDQLVDPFGAARVTEAGAAASDRGPNSGFGTAFKLTHGPDGAVLPEWHDVEGVDFAAGPSVAVAGDGTAHAAYLVYNSQRDTALGLYHATVTPAGWIAERVADAVMPSDLHQDRKTATAIAIDGSGAPHILFHPHPNGTTEPAVRYATRTPTGWTVEDPAAIAGGRLPVEDGYRAVPWIASRGTRVVGTYQVADGDVAVVERTGAGAWKLLTRLDDARFGRVALDGAGRVHVAWLHETSDQGPNRGNYGDLLYANEAAGWTPTKVAAEIEDRSKFWATSETDGSYAFALGPGDVPHFVWETDRGDRRFATLRDGTLDGGPTPLTPVHGNIQNRMRMAIDGEGNAHVVTGYGGSDLYGVRSPAGEWLVEERRSMEMFALALTPEGRVVNVFTQPHGGTTIAASFQGSNAEPPKSVPSSAPLSPVFTPGPTLVLAVGAVAGVGWFGAWGVRTASDRAPRWVWKGFALAGGFSRLRKDELLEHETRDNIVAAARLAPGRTAAELRRDLDLPRATFFYHLDRLANDGLLKLHRLGPQLIVYDAAQATPRSAPRLWGLAADLAKLTRERPGLTAVEYARLLDRPPRTVHHALRRLEQRGILRQDRDNARDVRWTPAPAPT